MSRTAADQRASHEVPAEPSAGPLVLLVLSLAQFMAVLDVSVVNVALPSIGNSLGLGGDALPWVITAYTVAFGGLLILGGQVADGIGRRNSFQVGLAVFTLASLGAGMSTHGAELLTARVAQGVGAALLSPAALSILTTEFTGKARNRALGVWAAIGAAGAAVGVVVGGALTSGPGWKWAFFINVPVGVLVFASVLAVVPARPRNPGTRLDLPGALTGTGTVALLIYGLVRAGDKGWGSAQALVPIGAAVLLAAGFVLIERSVRSPLVPLGLVRRPPLPGAVGTMVFATAALLGTYYLTSIYLQRAEHYSPLHAGLVFLPVAFATAVGAHLASEQVSRIGPRPTACAALLLAAAGMGLMSWKGIGGGVWTTLMPGFLLAAVGIGATFVTATTSGLSSVDPEHAGVASGVFNTGHEVGASLGIAVVSAVAATSLATASAPSLTGYRHAFLVLAIGAAALAVAVTALLPKGPLELGDSPMPMH
ncbi:MFS transporter [Actinacidiphila paucisporea]|uniref:Drug resistance transporter, EmrB/QacA subfamily n=1 Tax=Actinacidiphila paucisporea TaxID=310782 RepID=A0A1M7G7E9_9ACTN|nr:MFS transporter [Actinacidiphila paucisporea]SHM12171.1 drug resistance transporter, EmrB/QacA subfamily [Actinacidiphila paucisporea]